MALFTPFAKLRHYPTMIIVSGATVYGPGGVEFEVTDFLGHGSFGMVHKVKERAGNRVLAMKTIAAALTDQTALNAFVNEGTLAVGIRHPNVIEYLFFHDGTQYTELPPYILMEYATGGTLAAELTRAQIAAKQFSLAELMGMFGQLVSGMKVVNERLVHRDIKPDNILISEGALKISDFGLSKVVLEATRKLTFKGFGCMPYMAPEAWCLEKNTPQLDIYSMGIVFYELATLRHPFDVQIPDQQKWKDAHLYQPVTSPDKFNPSLGPKLAHVILKMLEKDSSRRFNDWATIEGLLQGGGLPPASEGTSLIQEMLKRRLEQDAAAQAAEAESRRKRDERSEFCKLVVSQAQKELVVPLVGLVDEFNKHYPSGKAILHPPGSSESRVTCQIQFPSTRSVEIDFRVVLDEDFIRERSYEDDFGRRITRHEVRVPTVQGRRMLGWGLVRGSDGRGFNIVLVERSGELYGEFLMLLNQDGFFSQRARREGSFPFDFRELEHEVSLIGVLHVYSITVKPFDAEYLCKFVSGYV